jgi:hypothetical protein
LEEPLKGSTRESSKRVLKILKAGVKPQFVGTGETEQKKLDQVREMLRRVVAHGQVEGMLEGQVPHEVEFANHKSFYDNLPFAVGEVVKMVITATLTVYRPGNRKPKVVNPLGVVNLPKGRLVLNGRYVNAFSKKHAFKYETLREILTFLSQSGFFSTWDFKAGYYHVTINPAFQKYFGIKVRDVYFHYNAMCFGWSGACLHLHAHHPGGCQGVAAALHSGFELSQRWVHGRRGLLEVRLGDRICGADAHSARSRL